MNKKLEEEKVELSDQVDMEQNRAQDIGSRYNEVTTTTPRSTPLPAFSSRKFIIEYTPVGPKQYSASQYSIYRSAIASKKRLKRDF